MPAIPGKKCLSLITYIQSPNRIMSVTTYWEPATAMTGPTVLAASLDAQNQIAPLLAALMPDQVTIPGTKAIYEDDTNFFDGYDGTAPQPGTAAIVIAEDPGSQVLPDQDALIIQRRTGARGRDARGRIFIPCLWEDFNNEGMLAAPGVGPANAVAAFLGADATFAAIICHARHWNRKVGDLQVVTQCRAMRDLGSRRDRQRYAPHLPA